MGRLYLGSHVGMSAPEYYLGSVKEALSYGSDTFMFYTGAPQNSVRKPLNELRIEEGRALMKQAGIDETKIVVHAPYIINGANCLRDDIKDSSILIISHQERILAIADEIVVVVNGRIEKQGPGPDMLRTLTGTEYAVKPCIKMPEL